MMNLKLINLILCGLLSLSVHIKAKDFESPPGTVINYLPSKEGEYIGSPSICILPNGKYIASHDQFGPKSTEFQSAQTLVFESTDKGETWRKISQINGQFWSNLFLFQGDLYIMGTNKHHGNVVLRKSTDDGKTWSIPHNGKNGLILEGEYHTAPVPIIEHNGRLWRAIEYATAESDKWGERYSAVMLSVPVNSDIMDANNWTRSNSLFFNEDYLGGKFKAWLEGNAVIAKNGEVVNILRVHSPELKDEYCAILSVDEKGEKMDFDESDFFKMPGAAKKFTIRYDKQTDKYWSIVNNVKDCNMNVQKDRIRNTISLISSEDLNTWTINKTLMHHSDHLKHGFQYVDWLFDGDNIVYVSRTAYDDNEGGAENYHNANYLTFGFVENFR